MLHFQIGLKNQKNPKMKKPTKHKCAVPVCEKFINGFMCVDHWMMLPDGIRNRLARMYDPFNASDAQSVAYAKLARQCIDIVEERLKAKQEIDRKRTKAAMAEAMRPRTRPTKAKHYEADEEEEGSGTEEVEYE
jgi:hypothetical protein